MSIARSLAVATSLLGHIRRVEALARSAERAVPASVNHAGRPKRPRQGRSKYDPHIGDRQRARVVRQVARFGVDHLGGAR